MFEDEDDILVKYLECSTDVARLLWATQEVHGGRIVHGARQQHFVQSLQQ